MTQRFNRDYRLLVGDTVIEPPFRIQFSCEKSIYGGLNKLKVKAWGLAEVTRNAFIKQPEQQVYTPINLQVGYMGDVQTIFKGSVFKGNVTRSGVDIVAEAECLDGGFDYLNSFTTRTVRGKDAAITELLKDMPNTGRGKITNQSKLIRPKVLSGQTAELIRKSLSPDETYYIDNEQLYIIKPLTEVVGSFTPVVTASTGLKNTPTKENGRVTFQTLMNPTLKLGGLCELKSSTAAYLNGVYRIETMNYSGDNEGADWVQNVTCRPAGNYKVL